MVIMEKSFTKEIGWLPLYMKNRDLVI
uniref:RpoC2 n=1 Tax=Arundo donax TaxID=35708 RepID=A0A0A9BDX8_ARUDO